MNRALSDLKKIYLNVFVWLRCAMKIAWQTLELVALIELWKQQECS